MKTPFCEVYVARGFCRLKPLETRPNVCLTIITLVFINLPLSSLSYRQLIMSNADKCVSHSGDVCNLI